MDSPLSPSIDPAMTEMLSLVSSVQNIWLPQVVQNPRRAVCDDWNQVRWSRPVMAMLDLAVWVAAT